MKYILESCLHKMISHISYSEGAGWGVDFLQGVVITPPKNEEALYVKIESSKAPLPDYFEVDGVPIVNETFIACLKSSQADSYQLFPVKIHFEGGIVEGYSLVNVVGRVKCFDLDRTDYSKFGPSVARVYSLKLVENVVENLDVFRADEYKDVIFISESVKTRIESAHIEGCEIRPADGWSDEHRF